MREGNVFINRFVTFREHDLKTFSSPFSSAWVYSLSNLGLQEKIIGKFCNTRSIQKLAVDIWTSELDVLESIRMLEQEFIDHLSQTPRPSPIINILLEERCTTQAAQKIRCPLWNIDIEGSLCPVNQNCTVVKWTNHRGCETRSIMVNCKTDI